MLMIYQLLLHTKRNALFYVGLFLLSLLFLFQWKFGFLYAWVDIAPDEIDPALNLYRSMFLWHDYRGLGLNFGFYNGWDISGNDSESFIIYYKYQRIYTILGLVSATVVIGLFFYLILGKYIRK